MRNFKSSIANLVDPIPFRTGPIVRPNHEMTLFELNELVKYIRSSYKLQKKSREQMTESLRTADKNCAELFVTLSTLESDLKELMIKHGMTDFSEFTTLGEDDL